MTTFFFCLLTSLATPALETQELQRVTVPDARLLMFAAIKSPDGEAHGVLAGEIPEAITKRFAATSPIYLDITTEKHYRQIGCSRLKVMFWQEAVLLPGTETPRKQTIEFGINYCLDGLPPKSLQ